MSRAFVKELDGEQIADDLPELPPSPYPNYMTPQGFCLLQEQVSRLQEDLRQLKQAPDDLAAQQHRRHLARDLRMRLERLNRAQVVDPVLQPRNKVAFGATVTVESVEGVVTVYTIVGEDEAHPDEGRISWTSPLAKALLNQEVDDEVVWQRPVGDLRLTVLSIEYAPGLVS